MKSDWQPIETAPKDGTDILAYDPTEDYYKPPVMVVAFGDGGKWWRTHDPVVEHSFPTHWMPLPDAPDEDIKVGDRVKLPDEDVFRAVCSVEEVLLEGDKFQTDISVDLTNKQILEGNFVVGENLNQEWLVKVTSDGRFLFNRETYPDLDADDFSKEVIGLLENVIM